MKIFVAELALGMVVIVVVLLVLLVRELGLSTGEMVVGALFTLAGAIALVGFLPHWSRVARRRLLGRRGNRKPPLSD